MSIVNKYHNELEICGWEWIEFNDIKEDGKFNMLDKRAREDSMIEEKNWFVIIRNYNELDTYFNNK
tara:strand:- start:325 stop:522 length:198 start_codon:yes stop_codon:yes gene_type:complete